MRAGPINLSKVLLGLMMLACPGFLAGCGDDAEAGVRDRQKELLADPFNYDPMTEGREDVSGGEIHEFDHKAFKRDMNRIFNP
jgi:hypothetical protein